MINRQKLRGFKVLMPVFIIILIILSVGLNGCAAKKNGVPIIGTENQIDNSKQKGDVAVIATDKKNTNEQSVKQDSNSTEELRLPVFTPPKQTKELPKTEPINPKRLVKTDAKTMLNVENMPLSDFIVYALGDILKVTFFIDEPVKGMKTPVTLRMTQEMEPDKVLEIVLGFLEKYELIIEERSGALYITKTRAQKKPMEIRFGNTAPDSSAEIMQIMTFKYLKAQEIEGLAREMFKNSGINMRVYFKENALIMNGPAYAIREIMDFINIFDVPYMQERRVFMIKLTYWQPEEFIKQISTILEGLGFGISRMPKDSGIYFIPVKVLNTVLVLAPDEGTMKYVLDWHRRLDTPESAGAEEKSYTYKPKYSKASDIVDALRRLYSVVQTNTSTTTGQQRQQSPAQIPAQTQQTSIQPTAQQFGFQPSATSSSTSQSAFALPGLKMASDDRRNIILISATPAQYKGVLGFLDTLDVSPKQVLIEATIAELTLKDDLKYGLEWYIQGSMNVRERGSFNLGTLGGKLGGLGVDTAAGIAYQFIADSRNIQFVMNALAKKNLLNILSNPRLMVIDNQDATIQVGMDVPILAGETKTTSPDVMNTVTTQAVQYRTTGLTLKVKPNINTEGLLSMDIAIENSEAQQNTMSKIDSPLILSRRLNTSVIASTEETIVLGGIMSENISDTDTKVPLVGDIPLLGALFKNTSKSKTKTELLIMIRPIIIKSSEEATHFTNELKKELKWFNRP